MKSPCGEEWPTDVNSPLSLKLVRIALAVLGVACLVILYHASTRSSAAPGQDQEVTEAAAGTVAARAAPHPEVTVLADTPFSNEFGVASTSAERELELVQLAFADYLQYVKEAYRMPFGDNADLVRLLTGGNLYQIAAIDPRHPRIDPDGRLTDKWGSPLDIHPLSSTAIEIRSAGPDRQLWTTDDLQRTSPSGQDILDRMDGGARVGMETQN